MSAQLAGSARRYLWALFAAIEVSVGGSTWRQVVWVSCRPGS
ncbi:MAG: hypothetical protein AABM41_01010 [Chloroflexota bacterium]